jgi:hypothetical protein
MRDFNDHRCPRCFEPVETGRRVGVLGLGNAGSPVGLLIGEQEATRAEEEEVTLATNVKGGMKGRQQGSVRVRGGTRRKESSLSIIHEEEEERDGCYVGQEEIDESKEGEAGRLSGEEVKKGYS